MTEEMKKLEALIWMFNNLNADQIEKLKRMALAMSKCHEQHDKKRPPLND